MATDAEDIVDAPDEGEAQEAPQLSEVEQLASRMGWKPEADYGGPKEKWKPAADFIYGEREVNRGLKQDVRRLRETVDRVAAASSKMTERALREQAEKIDAKFVAAVEKNDTQGAAKAAREMSELEASVKATPTGNNAEQDFASRNPWYNQDEDATAFAISISQREAAKGKTVPEQLEAVEKAIAKRFPEYAQDGEESVKPQQRQAPVVNAPARAQPKRDKGYADLPPAVKAAADSYAKLFQERHGKEPGKVRDQYAKDFWAEQGQ